MIKYDDTKSRKLHLYFFMSEVILVPGLSSELAWYY